MLEKEMSWGDSFIRILVIVADENERDFEYFSNIDKMC